MGAGRGVNVLNNYFKSEERKRWKGGVVERLRGRGGGGGVR